MKDPILDLLTSIYSREMFLTRKFREDQIRLWQERRQILIRDREDNPDVQAEDETLNHVTSFIAWYENEDGSIDYGSLEEDEYSGLEDFRYNGGALFTIDDAKEPKWYDGEYIEAMILRFLEWYSSRRSPVWGKYLQKAGY